MEKLDDTTAIEIADNIWWVGFADYEAGFSNNPYLLIDNDEAVLFDPGPGHPVFKDIILQKIRQIINPEKIKYIVVHHQDPDLCGLVPFIENILHPDLVIIAHPRTCLFIPYYGIRKSVLPVGDQDVLELRSGRKLLFYHTPYVHFAGSMVTYDSASYSLFSSDIFAAFDREWKLYADESYIELAENFIKNYVYGTEPIKYIYEKLKKLKIEKILPQHGGIIKDNVGKFINILKDIVPGQLLNELKNKPSPLQEKVLLDTGIKWMNKWLKEEIKADSLNELMNIAIGHGLSTVSNLIDTLTLKSGELKITNPLTYGYIHKWNNLHPVYNTQIYGSIRKKFLSRQYGILFGSKVNIDSNKDGLLSFKANLNIIFIDIRGFTKWCSLKSPSDVINILNKQIELVSRIITSDGGFVNKILGDGILGYFPENMYSNCIITSVKIHEAVSENVLLPVGIGCDFGEVIIGDIGEETRLDYTLIGAPVNFASRMCDNAKGGEIAVSNRVYERLPRSLKESISGLSSFEKIKVQMKKSDPETEGIKISSQNFMINR